MLDQSSSFEVSWRLIYAYKDNVASNKHTRANARDCEGTKKGSNNLA